MKKFTAPLTLALACIVYGLVVVCEFYFAAQAQGEDIYSQVIFPISLSGSEPLASNYGE